MFKNKLQYGLKDIETALKVSFNQKASNRNSLYQAYVLWSLQ